MTKPSATAFGDVRAVMDAAVENDGALYRLPSYNQAVNFQFRCNQWRKKQQALAEERMGMVPGIEASTPYDNFTVRVLDPAGKPIWRKPQTYKDDPTLAAKPHTVQVSPRLVEGQLLDPQGNPIDLTPKPYDDDGDLPI